LAKGFPSPFHGLSQTFVEAQRSNAFFRKPSLQTFRALYGHFVVSEILIVEYLTGDAFLSLSVYHLHTRICAQDLVDMLRCELAVLIAEVLAELPIKLARIDELHLAFSVFALVVRQQPDVGCNSSVVKQVVRKLDDTLKPV